MTNEINTAALTDFIDQWIYDTVADDGHLVEDVCDELETVVKRRIGVALDKTL